MRHQPHFHFKTNSPTSRGGAVCPLLHFMAPDFILRGRRSSAGGGGEGGRRGLLFLLSVTPLSPSTLFSFASTYPIISRCGRANSCSHSALLMLVSGAGGAVMIGCLPFGTTPRWCHSLMKDPVNSANLFHSHSLCYSPGRLLGLCDT